MSEHPDRPESDVGFVAYLAAYRPYLHLLADRLVHGHNYLTSSDLVQDVLIYAWQHCPEDVRDGSDERKAVWLTKAMVWIALNARRAYRAKKRDVTRECPLGAVWQGPEPVDPGPTPIEQAIVDEAAERLWDALDRLPPGRMLMIRLYYWEHQSIPRVAARLSMATSSVWNALRRIERNLRKQLGETGE